MTALAARGRNFYARDIKSFLPLLVFVAVTLLIGATFFSSFHGIETLIQDGELEDLGIITDTKVVQIARWRDRQQHLVQAFSQNSILAAEFNRWLQEGAPSNARKQRLLKMLSELQAVNNYQSVFLLDKQGATRLSLKVGPALDAESTQLAVQAMSSRKQLFSDLYRSNNGEKGISLNLIAPLTVAGNDSGQAAGAIVLQIDPYEYLYPLLLTWPSQSTSAETLLVRREGDDVLFLNEVRHKKDAALTMRLPLKTLGLPAAMAISGIANTVDGVDYRGVPVVSQMRQIAGTPWFVVSKIDRNELFAPVNRLKQWSTVLVMIYFVIGGALILVWLQGYKTRFKLLKDQHAGAVEREMLVKHYEYLTKYANDIILVTDDAGNIVDANERALQAYGYSREEMLHMHIPDLRPPSQDPALFQQQFEQIKQLGELRYETVGMRKNRTFFPIEVGARLIDVDGTRYVQGIVRDISEHKQAEDALRSASLYARSLIEASLDPLVTISAEGKITDVNEATVQATGVPRKLLVGSDFSDYFTEPDKARTGYQEVFANGFVTDYPLALRHVSGRIMDVLYNASVYRNAKGEVKGVFAAARDITGRKRAEQELRSSSLYARSLIEASLDPLVTISAEGKITDVNEATVQATGVPRKLLVGSDFSDYFTEPDKARAGYQEVFAKGFVTDYPLALRHVSGRIMDVLYNASVYRNANGEVAGIFAAARDITGRKRTEDALRKSETMLNESQQMAHIGSWELDLVNNILYWSDENYRIFEIDSALFGASYEAFLNCIHPDDRLMVGKVYANSVKNKTPYDVVHRLLFADQRVKFVREWCETYYDEAGQPLRSIGTTQDITEQQLAQNALHKSAQEIEDLYNNAPCGYQSLDPDGYLIRVNDTELHWLGYTRDELIAKKTFPDLLTAGSKQVFMDNFPKFKERGFIHNIEVELIRKDGSIFPVSVNASAIYDAGGQYVKSRTTLFDLSARKQVEKKLGESEERFRSMADNAPVMIWMTDVKGTTNCQGLHFFNQRWYEFTGLTSAEMQSRNWTNLIHPDDRKLCIDCYQEAFQKAQPFTLEYRLRRHDGAFRWIEDSGIPRFTKADEFMGFIGTCTDISERKQFETMRAEIEHIDRLNIAGEMASGITHELSQPLTAANNYLGACVRRMQANNWDREGVLKMVVLAHGQTTRAGQIIAHFKDLLRKKKIECDLLDINLLISDSLKFLEHELQLHSIQVRLDLSVLPSVLANKIEIEQVLINLVKNAIDSMRSAPRRELHIVTRVIESGSVLVTVGDTGLGVALEDMDKIFNPFQTSKKDGLGLGLAICRSIIENYGGKIWVEAKEDAGTDFNFTLNEAGT